MSQYGACCNPASNFPDPNNRTNRAGTAFNNQHREARRPTYFSRRLQHVSAVLTDPASITLREFAALLLVLFGLYRGFFAGGRAYHLLAGQDVALVCPRGTAMQCLRMTLWRLLRLGYDWSSEMIPWGLLAVVVVFFGEEILKSGRKTLNKTG